MTRITKPVEERRQEIIDTALELFLKDGFEKTQMVDISKQINVAAGTIYHYFKSKTELLYAVIDKLVEKKTKTNKMFNDSQGSALDHLKLMLTSLEQSKANNKLGDSLANDPVIIQYYMSKMRNASLPTLVSVIEKGNTDGSWKCEYPAETAVFILQGLTGVLSDELIKKDSLEEKRKRIKAYTNIIYRILDKVE